MAFNLDDYEPVAARIARFWADHPNGAIQSELVFDDGERCIIKATIYVDRGQMMPSAVDYAEEIRTDRGVNATSRIENCSTSAQGRALAALGYSPSDWTKKPSREEMAKVQRLGGSDANQPSASVGGLLTPKQLAFIKRLAKERGLDDEAVFDEIHNRFGSETSVLELLTSRQASQLIEAWK
jgi:hypothetical protein